MLIASVQLRKGPAFEYVKYMIVSIACIGVHEITNSTKLDVGEIAL
jgi:hypothetical protein